MDFVKGFDASMKKARELSERIGRILR